MVNRRSGSFVSYVAFDSFDSSDSSDNARNERNARNTRIERNVRREIDRTETLVLHDEHQSAVETIQALMPSAKILWQWLTEDELFPGSGQCKDCGDPLNQPGLLSRCAARHKVVAP